MRWFLAGFYLHFSGYYWYFSCFLYLLGKMRNVYLKPLHFPSLILQDFLCIEILKFFVYFKCKPFERPIDETILSFKLCLSFTDFFLCCCVEGLVLIHFCFIYCWFTYALESQKQKSSSCSVQMHWFYAFSFRSFITLGTLFKCFKYFQLILCKIGS